MKTTMRLAGLATCALFLCGCVSPQKLRQVEADKAKFDAQSRARDANAQCSQTAMPGTPQHLACRLAKTGGAP